MANEQSKASAGGDAQPGAIRRVAVHRAGAEGGAGRPQGEPVFQSAGAAAPGVRGPARAGDGTRDKRETAAPRPHIAANDDMPSIGGLIYALQQRPSKSTFLYAFIASAVWLVLSSGLGWALLREHVAEVGWAAAIGSPLAMLVLASIGIPIALFWFLALLIWRAQELRLMASAMTEVAVRLAEPDKMAEQSVASIGQTIRRQVAAMNDALSRALGRAGELEALVHNEVAALERSYSENELRIRSLIDELSSERQALANNSERVGEALRGVGAQVAKDISVAGDQATRQLVSATATIAATLLAKGEKITAAVSAAGQSIDRKLAERGAQVTEQLVSQGAHISERLQRTSQQVVSDLQQSTSQMTTALNETTKQVAATVDNRRNALVQLLNSMSESLNNEMPNLLHRLEGEQSRLNNILEVANQTFEALENSLAQRTLALDSALKQRTQAIQSTLSERIQALDHALEHRTQILDQSLDHRLLSLDESLEKRAGALEQALEQRAQTIEHSLSENTSAVERSLVRHTMALSQLMAEGTEAVQQTTDQLSAQSLQAAEGLSNQADMLKDVSKRLLEQIHSLTQRFENQGHAIMSAAQALDSSNAKIDSILERRHAEIGSLLNTVSSKARELDATMQSYSGMIENALARAEQRAKEVAGALAKDSAAHARAAVNEIEQMRAETQAHTQRAVGELKESFEAITNQVGEHIKLLTHQFDKTTREMLDTANRKSDEMESARQELQRRLRDMPQESKQSAEAVRKVLADQLKALSSLTAIAADQQIARLEQASTARRPEEKRPPESPRRAEEPRSTEAPRPARPAPFAAPIGPFPSPFAAPPQARETDHHAAAEANAEQLPPRPRPAPPPERDDLGSVTADLARQLSVANPAERSRGLAGAGAEESGLGEARREQWSLGDLLARASEPEAPPPVMAPAKVAPPRPAGDEHHPGATAAEPLEDAELHLSDIASALDDRTAAEVWQRYRRGERDILSRQIYSPRGQEMFDDISQRLRRDADFRQTVERYMADFERLLQEAQSRGRDGRMLKNYLVSETGRVYLLLAHASGRLR